MGEEINNSFNIQLLQSIKQIITIHSRY